MNVKRKREMGGAGSERRDKFFLGCVWGRSEEGREEKVRTA